MARPNAPQLMTGIRTMYAGMAGPRIDRRKNSRTEHSVVLHPPNISRCVHDVVTSMRLAAISTMHMMSQSNLCGVRGVGTRRASPVHEDVDEDERRQAADEDDAQERDRGHAGRRLLLGPQQVTVLLLAGRLDLGPRTFPPVLPRPPERRVDAGGQRVPGTAGRHDPG